VVKRILAAGFLALACAFGAAAPAMASTGWSEGACVAPGQAVCDTTPATGPELAETGSVLGHVELIVGATGGVLLAGSVLLVCATRRTTRGESRR